MDFADNPDITAQEDPDAAGTTAVTLGAADPVAYSAGGVTIATKVSRGASAKAALTTATTGRSVSKLPYNETGGGSEGQAVTTNITVTVTAANGYNDHTYTFDVMRAAPEDNNPATVTADGTSIDWVDDTIVDEEIVNAATDVAVSVTLEDGQTVKVLGGGNELKGVADANTDNKFDYTVSTSGSQTSVVITVTSEDDVAASMTINLQRAAG